MITKGLLARLEAKPNCAAELKNVLQDLLPLVESEAHTPVWFAIQIGPNTFGLFDAFQNEEDLNTHRMGEVPPILMAKAGGLLASPPVIEEIDIIAAKS